MKHHLLTILIASALTISVAIVRLEVQAQNPDGQLVEKTGGTSAEVVVAKTNDRESSPMFVTQIPSEYRDWKLISVAREEGELDDIRAILGNDIAMKAYREGALAFPEGAIIARVAWSYVASEENNKAFGRPQSFVAGPPKNGLQFMIKDSRKYAATGGWGYGQFDDGKPADAAMLTSCHSCHEALKDRDFVFTHYAP